MPCFGWGSWSCWSNCNEWPREAVGDSFLSTKIKSFLLSISVKSFNWRVLDLRYVSSFSSFMKSYVMSKKVEDFEYSSSLFFQS